MSRYLVVDNNQYNVTCTRCGKEDFRTLRGFFLHQKSCVSIRHQLNGSQPTDWPAIGALDLRNIGGWVLVGNYYRVRLNEKAISRLDQWEVFRCPAQGPKEFVDSYGSFREAMGEAKRREVRERVS